MREFDADEMIRKLKEKVYAGEKIERYDLVPLALAPLMSGKSSQKQRILAAYEITHHARTGNSEDVEKIEAVIYAMAEKFLDSMSIEEIREAMSMTRLGKLLVQEGIEKNKLDNARNLLDILDVETIAERIGLSLEDVKALKRDEKKNEK